MNRSQRQNFEPYPPRRGQPQRALCCRGVQRVYNHSLTNPKNSTMVSKKQVRLLLRLSFDPPFSDLCSVSAEKGPGIYQCPSSACYQVRQVLFGIQVDLEDPPRWQGCAFDPRNSFPASRHFCYHLPFRFRKLYSYGYFFAPYSFRFHPQPSW